MDCRKKSSHSSYQQTHEIMERHSLQVRTKLMKLLEKAEEDNFKPKGDKVANRKQMCTTITEGEH